MIETLKSILSSPEVLPFYGMAFWYVVNLAFPGANPVVKVLLSIINNAPVENKEIVESAKTEAKKAAKNIAVKLASNYIEKRLK